MQTQGLFSLQKLQQALFIDINLHIKRKAERWKLVRKLALESDGRSGYSGHKQHAYLGGRWILNMTPGHTYCINLNDPQLCYFNLKPLTGLECDLRVIGAPMELFDVEAIIDKLFTEALADPFPGLTAMTEKERDDYARAGGFERLEGLARAG